MTNLADDPPAVSQVLASGANHAKHVALTGGLTAVIIRQPGHALNVSAHRRIYQALVPVTSSSFGADMTPYWEQRSREGYLERLTEFILIADPSGTFVGWTGFQVLPHNEHTSVYLDSTGMMPKWQSKGVMRELMRQHVLAAALSACMADLPVYLAARSESPIFYRLMSSLVDRDKLFPHPTAPVPRDVGVCGQHLADWLGQRDIFDPSSLILRNAYGGTLTELYGELPSTGDSDLDKLFRGKLGPLDAYLIIGLVR